ncbi:2-oxoacid:acceptor oxidoreductase family protein [Clostridium sp. 'deep sea']|uniref:2-oxoacid:acceptor oxidoreductase family protein n=1 Tax=Clostridium sp. 'deep sea' TaxID=2779445 RepID=UPI00189640DF|nr:2-oxoacid:acceptor oxidoreductase family protein [Clostridium sp. 'deep sea']QOR36750.1 2-oxoacid:acceptor oxidoreductase family protein [Clostridium sp. 'deep sea']
MIEVRWHGRGGQGSFTIAKLLGMAASVYNGKYAQAFPSFGPERRGAPVLGFTRISEEKITDRSEVNSCDYVVVLDETLWGKAVLTGLKEATVIIINTDSPQKYQDIIPNKIITLDATKIALEILGRPITNTAMLGALVATSEMVSLDDCKNAIKHGMHAKIADKNIKLIDKAYHMVKGE